MEESAHSRPKAALQPAIVAQVLKKSPHRLGVVFWPELSRCAACDRMVSAVLSEWRNDPDYPTSVFTVIPANARTSPDTKWLPGHVVPLQLAEYRQFANLGPRPRIEIWSADGRLLLVRSIPSYSSQRELLTEEMLAARSFTAPDAETTKALASR
jgi:hypothetical protein